MPLAVPRTDRAVALGCRDVGRGPAIVLLHGVGIDGSAFDPVTSLLQADHRIIVPDRRGYGLSRGHHPTPDLDDQVADIVELLRARHIARPTLVGVSGGATIALAFALSHPSLLGRALVHEPALGPLAPALHARLLKAQQQLQASADPAAALRFVAALAGPAWGQLAPTWGDSVTQRHQVIRDDIAQFLAYVPDLQQRLTPPAPPLVSSLGEHSPPPRRQAADVLANAGAEIHVIPDAGHLAHLQAPAALATVIRRLTGTPDVIPLAGVCDAPS